MATLANFQSSGDWKVAVLSSFWPLSEIGTTQYAHGVYIV